MKCLWCNQDFDKLAKSHIIPKSFFNYDGANDRILIAMDDIKKKRRTGSYDINILCSKCEADYQVIDNDADRILNKNFRNILIPFNDEKDLEAYQISGEYIQLIKKFLIYTLWKASVSSLAEFVNIRLGVDEERIKDALINNTSFDQDEYSFMVYKIDKPAGMLLPRELSREDHGGIRYIELSLADYIFQIKMDKKKTYKPYRDFSYYENIVILKLKETPDNRKKAMIDVIKLNEQFMSQLKS